MFSPPFRFSINRPPLVASAVLSDVVGTDNAEDWEIGVHSSDVRMQVDKKAIIPIILEYLRVWLTGQTEGFPARSIITLSNPAKQNLDALDLEILVHHRIHPSPNASEEIVVITCRIGRGTARLGKESFCKWLDLNNWHQIDILFPVGCSASRLDLRSKLLPVRWSPGVELDERGFTKPRSFAECSNRMRGLIVLCIVDKGKTGILIQEAPGPFPDGGHLSRIVSGDRSLDIY